MITLPKSGAIAATRAQQVAQAKLLRLFAGLASLTILVGCATWVHQQQRHPLPDFAAAADVSAKKKAFFEYLSPKVRHANQNILRDRQILLNIQKRLKISRPLPWYIRVQLNGIAARYHIDFNGRTSDEDLLQEALLRSNIVPAPLVLIQAAKESGWGSSKFARLGYNLFGQQCFKKGCGFVPAGRDPGRRHEVARYNSTEQSIEAYLNNLNSHPKYLGFRQIRAELDRLGEPLTGKKLSEGLTSYSERGQAYVVEVQQMIAQNGLE